MEIFLAFTLPTLPSYRFAIFGRSISRTYLYENLPCTLYLIFFSPYTLLDRSSASLQIMETALSNGLAPSIIPSWAQSEAASAQSGPQQIAPEMHDKVFSWADVKDIVGTKLLSLFRERAPVLVYVQVLYLYSTMGRKSLPGIQKQKLINDVETNRLDVIRRKPSERVVYKAWCKDIITTYGSITAYMCAKRLQWTPLPDSSAETGPLFDARDPTPFADPRDYKVLRNDWPYGSFETGIVHLIVWSKSRIPTDKETGFVTPESKRLIEDFVQKTFVGRLEREGPSEAGEKVVWFKNWSALQSVPGLEHVHVLVKDAPESIVDEWTGEEELQS